MLNDLLSRLLRTETLAVIAALVLFALGRVETLEEALAMSATVSSYIVGRSMVKANDQKNGQK